MLDIAVAWDAAHGINENLDQLPLVSRAGGVPRPYVGSERSDQATKRDDDYERDKRSDDRDHDDVHIALGMRRTADREQGYHGAVVRQAVQRTRADDRDAMQQRRIDTLLPGETHIGWA